MSLAFRRPKRCALVLLSALSLAACSSAAQKAQNYYDSGQKLLAAHDDTRAALEFRNAVRLKKDMLPAWKALAGIDERLHNWPELVTVLRNVTQLDPKDVEAKIKLARLMLVGGAADQALKLINSIPAASSENASTPASSASASGGPASSGPASSEDASVLALKAAIFYKLKDNNSATREAQSALKIDSTNLDALIVLAAVHLDEGDANGALQILNSDAGSHDKDVGLQLFKIKIFEKLGQSPQVEALLDKLIELYPQDLAFRTQLAKFDIEQRRPDDAEKQLRAIAAADPKNAAAELNVVRFLFATKGAAAARAELLSRIAAGGDIFPYQMALADFDFAQGDDADSFKLLETLAADTSAPDHAMAAKIKLAEMNLARKKVDAADALVSSILSTDSRNIDGLRLRALIHLDRGQIEPAISDLRAALNDQPHSTVLMLMLASAYERSGSIELAEKELADATKISNYDPNVGLAYVAFLRRRGSIDRAEQVLTDLDAHRPNNLAILTTWAEVKLALQDWAGAQQIAETIKRLKGDSGVADQILGAALGGEGKSDQSIAALQGAVAAQPTAVQPMVALVTEMVRAKETDRAIAFLNDVLKTNPANAEALVLLGSVQLSNNAPDQAIASFNAAIAKQPKDIVGYRALADLYVKQKKNDAALQVIQAGLKERPDDPTLHMTLAGLFELSQNYEGAIQQYQLVLNQQPGSLLAANNLASMLADHRSDPASLAQAQTLAASLRSTPIPQFKDTLGWIDYRQGDYKSAIPLLETAASALPDLAVVHYHLGMAYVAAKQMANAAEQFKMALAKNPSDELATEIKNELKKTATE